MKSKKGKIILIVVAAVAVLAIIGGMGGNKDGGTSSSASPSAQATDYAKYAGTYTIYRTDYKVGVLDDYVGSDPVTCGLKADDYVVLGDGTISMSISGVGFNSKYELSKEEKVYYSGQKSYPATRMTFEGKDNATQGTLTIEGYIVDDCPYMVISTSDGVNGKFTTFYCYYAKQ